MEMINGTATATIIAEGATGFLAELAPVIFLVCGVMLAFLFISLLVGIFQKNDIIRDEGLD